jgi:acyl-CoA reductase-like NAD-dependent aldehyde dehydrogenase
VSLELGGKSPNIVFADANLENAARGIIAGIFASCGQSCVAGSRLLVQNSVKNQVLGRVIELASQIRMGDPMDEATEMGPIANRQQYDRILRYIEIAKKDGAKLVLGGKPASRPECGDGLFIEPTIFDEVDNKMRIAQEEVFGPVLSVITFEDEKDAVRIANDTVYGLGSGIWTNDLKRAHRVAAQIQAGSVWINTYRISSQLSPFGGYKRSGLGREGGAEMLKSYTQTKSIWLDLNTDFPYPFKGR